MKGGRPPVREEFRREILDALSFCKYPATASTVKRILDGRRIRRTGWDTVHKYLAELADDRLILRQSLPVERGHKPLVVYMGRPGPARAGGEFLGRFSTD